MPNPDLDPKAYAAAAEAVMTEFERMDAEDDVRSVVYGFRDDDRGFTDVTLDGHFDLDKLFRLAISTYLETVAPLTLDQARAALNDAIAREQEQARITRYLLDTICVNLKNGKAPIKEIAAAWESDDYIRSLFEQIGPAAERTSDEAAGEAPTPAAKLAADLEANFFGMTLGQVDAARTELAAAVEAERCAAAIERCDWSTPSIGNKAILQQAVKLLRTIKPGDPSPTLPDDLLSHRASWRKALVLARNNSPPAREDFDDRAYWQHELEVFDRVYAELIKSGAV